MYLRKEWDNPKFYEKYFGKNPDMNKYYIKELQRKLSLLPQEQEEYTIAAYGSLMNTEDIPRTLGNKCEYIKGFLPGYERIFDVGNFDTGSYLNIRPLNIEEDSLEGKDYDENGIIVNLITVSKDKIPDYIMREGYYEPEIVTCYYDNGSSVEAITVISDHDQIGLQPMLNYVHLCVSGAKEFAGIEGLNCMMNNTMCYSTKQCSYISLKEWLSKVNLVNLMIQQPYTKR
jgi:hypothetical protein